MSLRAAAEMYRNCRHSNGNIVATGNRSPMQITSNAVNLRCHSTAPASVEEYERWFASVRSSDPRGKTPLTGAKIRRAVVMRRNGCSIVEVQRALSCKSIHRWLSMLPPELAI